MKSIIISSLISLGVVTSTFAQDCPQSCTITTYGTPWDFANVRPTPCNNRRPYAQLTDGDVVYNLGENQFGCGYWYTQVLSGNKVGWVASQFLDCGGNPPVPAAALADNNPSTTGSV